MAQRLERVRDTQHSVERHDVDMLPCSRLIESYLLYDSLLMNSRHLRSRTSGVSVVKGTVSGESKGRENLPARRIIYRALLVTIRKTNFREVRIRRGAYRDEW